MKQLRALLCLFLPLSVGAVAKLGVKQGNATRLDPDQKDRRHGGNPI